MFIISFLCLFLLVALFKIFHKLWWTPIRIQRFMNLQGIKGPSYEFLHGSTKEMVRMQMEARAKPMSLLSHNIFPRLQPHIYLWANLYGKLFLEWYGPRPRLVINDPELAKEILNNKDRVYSKPEVGNYLKKLVGEGLGFLEGEKFPKRRKLFNHAFNGDILKGMIPSMVEAVEKMIAQWKCYDEGKEIEVYEQFRLLTSEVISRTAFGSSYFEGKNTFDMLAKLTVLSFANLNKLRFPGISKLVKTQDEIESEKLDKGINQLIMDMINKREYKFKNGEEDNFGNDFLGLLLKSRYEAGENESITLQEVIAECKTVYHAGQKTVNSCLAWTMLLLAIHTEWQEQARKEVLDSFGKRNPNANDIAKLKKMSMIINESLRLYPPATETSRQVKKQVRLGKHTILAGTELFIPFLAFHHDPRIWGDDVHLFKPERFSEGVANATKDIKANAYFPFGFGPRICVGMNFALVQAKIALAMILQNYSFTVSPTYVHSPIRGLTSVPQHGIQIMLRFL